jgi:ribosomal protein L12E/L44/L45/RPP1/RPP2
MESIYAALILYEGKKEISEDGISAILAAVGITPDVDQVKSLVKNVNNLNLSEILKNTIVIPPHPVVTETKGESKKKVKKENKQKDNEEKKEIAGLRALFGDDK